MNIRTGDRHGVVGESSIVARSFSEFLSKKAVDFSEILIIRTDNETYKIKYSSHFLDLF